jgi:hypothetical protein
MARSVLFTSSVEMNAMKLERTARGLEARFQVTGLGRFGGAAFLALWLIFWAAFEVLVLWVLAKGSWALLTSHPPAAGHQPLALGVALPLGLFLLFWLSFWTLGGLAAGHELLRLLFARDRIVATLKGLEIAHGYGLFHSRREVGRDEIRRFYRQPSGSTLCVETTLGAIELTQLGTADELAELEQALNQEFEVEAQPAPEGALPRGWREVVSPERDRVLVKDPAVRRKQALAMWIVCMPIASGAFYLALTAVARPDLRALALMLAAIAVAVGWGAVWLSFGRDEWRLDKGRLVLQRRFGMNRTRRFEAVSVELAEDHSGDSGPWYELKAVAASARSETRPHQAWRHRRTIHRQPDDPTEPRNLGLWLSQRCQLPVADRTTAEAKSKELDALMQQLADSGRLGRAASRLIGRVASSRYPPKV